MAYSGQVIRERTLAILQAAPRLPLAAVARRMGLDRHTVERALKAGGVSFRDLQRDCTLRLATRLLSGDPPMSLQLVAYQLGFPSPGALTQFLRRNAAPDRVLRGGNPPQTSPFATGRNSDSLEPAEGKMHNER